jgi:light-regulated signal transduction histidine kinase (bacteriophytochrome)
MRCGDSSIADLGGVRGSTLAILHTYVVTGPSTGDILTRVLGDFTLELEEAGAEVIVGDLPQVIGESASLASLFQNLLGNALKYRAPDREPKISVTAERVAPDL